MVIEFSDKLVNAVRKHAKKRHDSKDISFRNARRFHQSRDQYEPHTVGLFGEVAYAKLKGLKVNTLIYPVRDGGEDFKNIEVKTITYYGPGEPELKIPLKKYVEGHHPVNYIVPLSQMILL